MKFILFFLLLCCIGCSNEKQKRINVNSKVINIRENIREISFDDLLFNTYCSVDVFDDILLICDRDNYENQIHLIDKNTFHHLVSIAPIGQGPGEITSLGAIFTNEEGTEIYVQDLARYQIFVYPLDSILSNPEYKPIAKWNLNRDIFPATLQRVNDTLCIGTIGMPLSPSEIHIQTGFWNMETNTIRLLDNLYPEDNRIRYDLAASLKNDLIVEAHWYKNRIVLRSFNGEVKCRIEGNTKNNTDYYRKPLIVGDKILVFYLGYNRNESLKNRYLPAKIIVLDINGNYIETLDSNYAFNYWCYDEDNHRLIFNINDEIQFGYLDLDNLEL